MICAQPTIDRVREHRARELWRLAETPVCPIVLGKAYGLQAKPFQKAQVTITVTEVATTVLGGLTEPVAKRLGFASLRGAMAELDPAGVLVEDDRFWALGFVVGDHSEFMGQGQPLYLHRNPAGGRRDYTTRPDLAAVGEPEVVRPELLAPYVEQARLGELARASNDERFERLHSTREDVQALARGTHTRQSRNRIRRILHDLDRLAAEERERYTGGGSAGERAVSLA